MAAAHTPAANPSTGLPFRAAGTGAAGPFPYGRTLFVVVLALHLAPLWIFRYFPSQDGPSHVENADIIRRYADPASSLLRRYYALATHRELNWLGHLILAGLRALVPPAAALRLFLAGYVILLPLSVLFALRSITPRAGPWAFFVFPFVYNYPVHMGFFNFAWSTGVFFLLIGWFLRGGRPARFFLGLSGLSLLLFLFHPGTWAMGALTIAILAGFQTLGDWIGAARSKRLTAAAAGSIAARDLAIPFLALLPALLLMLRFASHAGGVASVRPALQRPTELYAAALLNEFAFRNDLEHRLVQSVLAALLLSAAALLVFKVFTRSFSRGDALFLVPAAFLAIGFVTPDDMLNGQFLRPRLVLFVCMTLILWLGSEIRSRSAAGAVLVFGSVISVGLLAARLPAYRQLDSLVSEYVSAGSAIGPHRTLLPLDFLPMGPVLPGHGRIPMNIHVFQHTSGYIASDRNVIDLANYEANIDDFPVMYRPEMNPYKKIGDVENNQGRIGLVDLAGYGKSGGTVDYVLLWGAPTQREAGTPPDTAAIFAQLSAGYDRIFVSRPRGLGEVYRRKGLRAGPPL